MKEKQQARPKHKNNKPVQNDCPYCGSEKIEHVYIKHVGSMRVCKECREEF